MNNTTSRQMASRIDGPVSAPQTDPAAAVGRAATRCMATDSLERFTRKARARYIAELFAKLVGSVAKQWRPS